MSLDQLESYFATVQSNRGPSEPTRGLVKSLLPDFHRSGDCVVRARLRRKAKLRRKTLEGEWTDLYFSEEGETLQGWDLGVSFSWGDLRFLCLIYSFFDFYA